MVQQQATSVICPRTGTSSSIPLSLLHPKVIRLRAVSLHPIRQRQLLCAIHHPHRSPWNRGTQENLLPNFRHLHSRLVSCWNHLRLWYQQAISLIANPISGRLLPSWKMLLVRVFSWCYPCSLHCQHPPLCLHSVLVTRRTCLLLCLGWSFRRCVYDALFSWSVATFTNIIRELVLCTVLGTDLPRVRK